MSIVSGHGGFLFFYADEADAVGATVNLDTWVGDWQCEYVPATPAGSGGGTLLLPVIGTHSWRASFPLDAVQAPEDVGLTPGAGLFEAWFRVGNETNGGKAVYDVLERTTVTGVQMMDDNKGDAFRVVVTGSGGRLTQGTSP